MRNVARNTDFAIFGTYRADEADILERELEKHGIPVKVIYPGTEIGRGVTANMYFTAYTLMIRVSDFQKAKELQKKFNIKPIEAREKMPLPKPYDWAKRGLNRILFIGWLISFLGILVSGYLSYKWEFFPENTNFYFITAFFIFFIFWLCGTAYNILKERKNH